MAAALPAGLGDIIKVLPTGTVFLFQFCSPILSNYGNCQSFNKYLTAFLVGCCGLSCFFSSFTDSCVVQNKIYYGFITPKGGLWPSPPTEPPSGKVNQVPEKIGFTDFVHAILAVIVFGAVVLLDTNTENCFYPVTESTHKTLLSVVPAIVGAVCSVLLPLYPCKRHGIGYPSPISKSQKSNASGSKMPLTREPKEGDVSGSEIPLTGEPKEGGLVHTQV
ncbi:protein DMP2-like [Corylus avellana]|uniref:protein DMP2-like n=1 Tax=Corylus avellana TaxID=13451 RepID=UPI001E208875|nr:protein DMP2-like [Corylus avellana]